MTAEYNEHIKKIVEILGECISSDYGLSSIVLYGGFARGEGRMIDTHTGKIPYGDYDILVITKKSIPDRLIQNILEDRIYGKVMYGTSIDITNETVSALKHINCDLSSYDLARTGKTIWGKDLLDNIKIDIEDIPIMSFARILNNRLNVVLTEYEKGQMAENKKESLRKSIIKLYLDIGGYLTFIYKVYSPFFEERIKELKKIKRGRFPRDLVTKIEIATEAKLNPEKRKDLVDRDITDAIEYGVKIIKEIIARIINKDINFLSAKEIAQVIYKKLPIRYYQEFIKVALRNRGYGFLNMILPLLGLSANLYENIYFRRHAITSNKFSLCSEWRSPIIINMAITILLIFCLAQGENRDYLCEASNYLKKIVPFSRKKKEYNFEEIREANTSLWLGYTRRARKRNISKALSDLFKR